MTLHDKILRISRPPSSPSDCTLELIAFEDGHTTALKAAAKLAAEQDTLVEELVGTLEELEAMATACDDGQYMDYRNASSIFENARDLIHTVRGEN